MTLTSSPGCAGGFLGGSSAPISGSVVAGFVLYPDPTSLIIVEPLSCTPTTVIGANPVPLSFAGISVFLQTAHSDLGGIATSSGLAVTFL